jgi:orotate phosphoribosyltransferase
MNKERSRLIEILRSTSVKVAAEPVFRLASGVMSRHYVDCKQALSDPEARELIGEVIAAMVEGRRFDAIGGMELGAYPIAIAASDAIYRRSGQKSRVFVVRKEPKSHGIRDLIAGNARAGDSALIVEDVVTSGGSTIKAIRSAREAGLKVDEVIALIDREEGGGSTNLEAEGVKFCAIFRLNELLEATERKA